MVVILVGGCRKNDMLLPVETCGLLDGWIKSVPQVPIVWDAATDVYDDIECGD